MKAIKYGAVWCGPCRQMTENLTEAGIKFTEVDVDEFPDVADTKNITTIPVTEFIDDNNNVIKRVEGLMSVDNIRAIMQQ